jgi:hypothetical protein
VLLIFCWIPYRKQCSFATAGLAASLEVCPW